MAGLNLARALTPPDTEEVKPGLFIQKRWGNYRHINPAAWDGKVIWRNFLFGGQPIKHLFIFLLILGLAWSYQNDIAAYQDFYETVRGDPVAFCSEVREAANIPCTQQQQQLGLCTKDSYNLDSFDPNILKKE